MCLDPQNGFFEEKKREEKRRKIEEILYFHVFFNQQVHFGDLNDLPFEIF